MGGFGVRFLNSLCSLRTFSPDSLVFALGMQTHRSVFQISDKSKAVCFFISTENEKLPEGSFSFSVEMRRFELRSENDRLYESTVCSQPFDLN